MKKLFSKRTLLIGIPVLLLVGLVGGAIFFAPLGLATPLEIKISTGAVAEAGASNGAAASSGKEAHATDPRELPSLPYVTRERVVNLADKGGYRYLKIEVVLDVAIPHSKPGDKAPKGEAAKKLQEELTVELAPLKARLEDAITTTLTSKTSEELMTSEGKQRLKDELRAKLDRVSADYPITGVYFTQFIIQ